MKLKFDANQQYQLDAVSAVVDLFEGQPGAEQGVATFEQNALTSLKLTEVGLANRCVLTDEQWLENLHAAQKRNRLPESEQLETLKHANGKPLASFPNFTVEMETGTGKTYVYLRSIHELHRQYGFKKFVIVVPSVAIREGVLSSLRLTAEHFRMLFDAPRTEFTIYDSRRVNQLRNFALSDALQILVINIDAFAKDSDESGKVKSKGNVINQLRETGNRPIEFIQAVNPIVILDEPQNLETDKRKQAIVRLKPLCTLRYSATHRDTYNLIYKLDPVAAYEKGLVKQVSVDSVLELTGANQAFIELESFKTGARSLSAKATIWQNQKTGPKKKRVTLQNGADLYKLSNEREIYKGGYIVNELDAEQGIVRFANDVTVRIGMPHGSLGEDILKLQIDATVKRHFEKAKRLEPMGIKVLSVFFIDRVSSYRVYNEDGSTTLGPFGEWFEEIYAKYANSPEYANLYKHAVKEMHNGYFAKDKKAVSPYAESDFKTKTDAEGGAFELIMKDKERLLDVDEPLRFIFSHSALREGWDNPNVFQICTLAETGSEMKKRQEIGRGLRLCVNQQGERVFERELNRLTVIANETYEDFARQLQTEFEADGIEFKSDMVKRERDKLTVRLRKGYQADERFLELWQRIRERTKYRISYDTATLIHHGAAEVRKQMPPISRPKVAIERANIGISREGVSGEVSGYTTQEIEAKFVIPDLIAQVQSKTELSRSTIARILLECGRLEDALKNPQLFIDHVAALVNVVKRRLLVDGVKYLKVNGLAYEMREFEADEVREVFESNLYEVKNPEKTLFSHIDIDSGSIPERKFAEACDTNDDVLFYIKLPRWFVIETPVGPYNPDWALAYKNNKTLYFVAETKGAGSYDDPGHDLLRPIEKLKIDCGFKHFQDFKEVQFKVVKNYKQLLA